MSTGEAKKRKVSLTPVLQDYTVTSFSDFHSDVGGPSDSSLFEELKSYDAELPGITFNETSDISLFAGPFPSDSSLDSLMGPPSNKKTPAFRRPFHKKPKKKSVEENPFDSCLKDSFSDNSLLEVQRPFQRKTINKARLSMFDADLESSNCAKESPFKKPFQRKSKVKKQSDLFDSILKDSQPNTPDQESCRKPFQRKSKKGLSTDFLDDVLANESINQPTPPVHNLITRMRSRCRKNSIDNNIFDEDLCSSQSDISTTKFPLNLKNRNPSKSLKNDTEMFDDILESTYDDEATGERCSDLSPNDKINSLNKEQLESGTLVYHEETDCHSKDNDSTICEMSKDFHRMDGGEALNNENEDKANKSLPELSSVIGTNIHNNNTSNEKSINLECNLESHNTINRDDPSIDSREPDGDESSVQSSNQNKFLEDGLKKSSQEENNTLAELRNSNLQDIETISLKMVDKSTIHQEDEQTLEFTEDKTSERETDVSGELATHNLQDKETNSQDEEINSQDEETLRLVLENEETTLLQTEDENTREPEENVSETIAKLRSRSISLQDNRVSVPHRLSVIGMTPYLEPNSICLNGKEMLVCTPDESFKGMPSSTPNLKGKRVSFMLKEETCMKDSRVETEVSITNNFTRRKSSIRSINKNCSSNLVKDNSTLLRNRRVSFKEDYKVSNSLNQSDFINKNKSEQSKENKSKNYNSSLSLESLVYLEPSGSGNQDSESVYIDIHPSRGKSTSSNNPESFSTYRKDANVKEFQSQSESKILETRNHCTVEVDKCDFEENRVREEYRRNSSHSCMEGIKINDAKQSETDSSYEIKVNKSNAISEELDNKSNGTEDALSSMSESDVEEQTEVEETRAESPSAAEQESEEQLDSDQETGGELESDEESKEELESEEEQDLLSQGQEKYINEITGDEEFNNDAALPAHDENLVKKTVGKFKTPIKKKKVVSKFEEKPLQVPSKSQLKDILNKMNISDFKKKNLRKSSEHYISKEQMQQYEIEEQLIKNHNKKCESGKQFTASKLKRPRKWVNQGLYDFLINKLKPLFGIASHMKAEELVFYLAERVDSIMRKKELLREDVEEMKTDLATLGVVKTHWDFFKFVNRFFDNSFKQKMYPLSESCPSAFKFGPTNVLENIL